jgi:homoserine O-succinyltransferase
MGTSPLTRGFDDIFYAPQSRHSYCSEEDIQKVDGLRILARSPEAGVHISARNDMRLIFVSGHNEYDKLTLDMEYRRDLAKGESIALPKNYFIDDDPEKGVIMRWRSHGSLMFGNWLNYCVYQETPYDLGNLQPIKLSR